MKTTGRKLLSLILTLAVAISLMPGTSLTVLAETMSVEYVERSWDGTKVVSTTKTAECVPITSDMENMGGPTPSWYVVNGNVVNDNRLVVWGVVNIILTDGSSLTLKDGISVQSDRTLNIYAQSEGDSAGALICGADTNDNAAIGSNEETGACGTINIHGGKVTADTKTNGEDAAGIGGGEGGDGGSVVIYGGTVKAYGGSVNDEGGAGIGGGDRDDNGGNGGTTVIYGGDVTAIGGANAAGIGGGDDGGDSGNIYIYGGTVNATGGSKNSRGGAGIGGGGIGDGKCIEIRGGNVIARGGANAAGIGGGDEGSGGEITITGGTVNAKGGSVYSDGGAGIGGGNEKDGGTIRITGGEVTSQGGCDAAGIGGGDYGEGGTITITGGTISATGGEYGAGIGGGQSKGGGTITITGGTITAISGVDGAGIGGGENGAGGTITINSSSEELITAKSVENGAGIGGGDEGAGGNITIENGQIIATGGSRNAQAAEIVKIYGGAGIGGGCQAAGGEITINDGNIEAQGGYGAAGIGGGSENSAGMVSISGGTIVAKGGVQENGAFSDSGGAGIGNGYIGPYDVGTGTISISGGNVTATGAGRGAGIGGGSNSNCSKITISGGTVNATGDIFAAGIGGGNEGKSGTIHITGGDVTATGGESGAGIGSGCACENKTDAVNVTIDGGTVHASPGGEYEWHTGENDDRKNWETRAGAAIGAGGNRYMKGNNHREENTYSYFSGAVRLNGGEVYLIAKKMCVIGSTEFAGLVADTGRVEFNGAKVVKQGESYTATMVNVSQGQVILKENDTLHQMVLEDDYPGELDFDNPRRIVPKDDRISYLISSANYYIAVTPCDHRNSTYEDKGTVHSLTCKYCTYEKAAEEHTYGEPTYTWSEDNSTVTATRVCGACKHEETETVSTTSEISKQPTCTEKGETTYTSAAFENTAFEVQTKTEEIAIDSNAHSWGDISYTWSADNSTVTATRECKNDSSHVETETVDTTSEITKQPTCTEKGETTYTSVAFENTAFEAQTKTEEMAIDPNAHSWGEITYTWSADNSSVTATRVCAHNADHTETETVGTTSETTKQPTCTEKGETTYTSLAFGNEAFAVQAKTLDNINAIDHDWDEWTQTQAPTCSAVGKEERVCRRNADHKETRDVAIDPKAHKWGEWTESIPATETTEGEETRVCEHNAEHKETRPISKLDHVHRLSHVDVKPATCTEAGNIEYWVCTEGENPCGRYFADAEGTEELNAEELVIAALNHAWGEITYKWADDNSEVTATRVCEHDATHVETETADVTSEITKQPTCSAAGETTYTATFENPAFAEQSKTEEDVAIDPDAHAWGAVAYEWADDNSEVTATRTCAHNATHKESETVKTKAEVSKQPTCSAAGETTYTATFENPAFAEQSKTEEDVAIDPDAHAWGAVTYTWADDNSEVTATRICAHDAAHTESETVKTESSVTKEATETEEGERTYTATFTTPAFAKQTKTESISKTDPVKPDPGKPDPVKPDQTDPDPGKQDSTDPAPQPQPAITYTNTEGDGAQWTKGSAATADFTFKRSEDDSETFSHFTGIQVDGKDVAAANYTAEAGSVIVKLKPAYLETLSVGEHTITALFDDGNKTSAKFTVVARKASGNSNATNTTTKKANRVSSTGAPKTGDTSNMLLWITILCASILVLFNVIIIRRRNGFGRRG